MRLKTLFTTLLIAASTTVTNAENWVSVQDAENGNRLLVDSDSFTPSKGDDGTVFIAAIFRYVNQGEPRPAFAYVTEASACPQKGGTLYHRTLENGAWVTKQKYWWSKTGGKMYDAGGQTLCDILAVRMRENTDIKKPERKMY